MASSRRGLVLFHLSIQFLKYMPLLFCQKEHFTQLASCCVVVSEIHQKSDGTSIKAVSLSIHVPYTCKSTVFKSSCDLFPSLKWIGSHPAAWWILIKRRLSSLPNISPDSYCVHFQKRVKPSNHTCMHSPKFPASYQGSDARKQPTVTPMGPAPDTLDAFQRSAQTHLLWRTLSPRCKRIHTLFVTLSQIVTLIKVHTLKQQVIVKWWMASTATRSEADQNKFSILPFTRQPVIRFKGKGGGSKHLLLCCLLLIHFNTSPWHLDLPLIQFCHPLLYSGVLRRPSSQYNHIYQCNLQYLVDTFSFSILYPSFSPMMFMRCTKLTEKIILRGNLTRR